jgi:hypothetical protein
MKSMDEQPSPASAPGDRRSESEHAPGCDGELLAAPIEALMPELRAGKSWLSWWMATLPGARHPERRPQPPAPAEKALKSRKISNARRWFGAVLVAVAGGALASRVLTEADVIIHSYHGVAEEVPLGEVPYAHFPFELRRWGDDQD